MLLLLLLLLLLLRELLLSTQMLVDKSIDCGDIEALTGPNPNAYDPQEIEADMELAPLRLVVEA